MLEEYIVDKFLNYLLLSLFIFVFVLFIIFVCLELTYLFIR